jgi:hypothetical protein
MIEVWFLTYNDVGPERSIWCRCYSWDAAFSQLPPNGLFLNWSISADEQGRSIQLLLS